MAEETAVLTDRIERIDERLDRLEQGQGRVESRLSRLEGLFEQMNQRIANLEQTQRWGLGLWAVLVLAVLGLYFKG